MAFKMRRSGMQLRSTTSTKPITTRFSSPLHQEFDISTEGDNLIVSTEGDLQEQEGTPVERETDRVYDDEEKSDLEYLRKIYNSNKSG